MGHGPIASQFTGYNTDMQPIQELEQEFLPLRDKVRELREYL